MVDLGSMLGSLDFTRLSMSITVYPVQPVEGWVCSDRRTLAGFLRSVPPE